MKSYIFILFIVVLYLFCDNTPLIEGYGYQQDLLNTFSTKQREDLEAIKKRCYDDVRDVIGDLSSLEDLNHEQKKDIIKDIIRKYNDVMKLDVDILNEVMEEMLEEDIYTMSDEEKNRKRDNLRTMMDEFEEYYNINYHQTTKDTIHKKHKDFRNNQNCDKECTLKNNRTLQLLNKANREINKHKVDIKKLQETLKKINNRVRINKVIRRKRWNSKPSGVIFTNKFPKKEFNDNRLKCQNNKRKLSGDPEKCNKMCRNSKGGCKYVWQYKNFDRCCFKTGFKKNHGFRMMNRPRKHHGWYTSVY